MGHFVARVLYQVVDCIERNGLPLLQLQGNDLVLQVDVNILGLRYGTKLLFDTLGAKRADHAVETVPCFIGVAYAYCAMP